MKDDIKKQVNDPLTNVKVAAYFALLDSMFYFPFLRKTAIKLIKKRVYLDIVENNKEFLKNVQLRKYDLTSNFLDRIEENISKGYISKNVPKKFIETVVRNQTLKSGSSKEIKKRFFNKYKIMPPNLIVLAPTQKCGLSCKGCYASSRLNAPTLSYDIVDKITNELYNEWGSRFMVITGGEPFMYFSEGKNLFDLWKKYSDMFFLVYTNGNLISPQIAKKISEVGNVSPCISIEGFMKETDERRGKGVFNKILEAAKNLRNEGIPFGMSVTATAKNFDLLMKDDFYDFVFKEVGASYLWLFQLMPVGKAVCMKDSMINPIQRVKLYRKWEYLLKEKKYPIADFWNSGVLSNGCIAYGRSGGYCYIDWNGNIMPCAFVPFYEDNIINLYKNGKTLTDAMFSKLFKNGRNWQDNYGFSDPKKSKNLLTPCSIRDHFDNFKKNIYTKNSKPEDKYAEEMIKSKNYKKVLDKFDKDIEKKTKDIWKKEYLNDG